MLGGEGGGPLEGDLCTSRGGQEGAGGGGGRGRSVYIGTIMSNSILALAITYLMLELVLVEYYLGKHIEEMLHSKLTHH